MSEIKDCIDELNLPEMVCNHIEQGLKHVLKYGVIPISIIVFGSSLREDFNEQTSDIDWILVVEDSVSDSCIDDIRIILQKESPRQNELEGFLGSILKVVGLQTGMYVSGFVAKRMDITNLLFERIFNVSRYTARIFAPSQLVLRSVFSNAQTIYGENLIPSDPYPNQSSIQILKSIVMNFLLSTCALIISPFTDDAIRFTAESIKWSIYAKYSYTFNKNATINESIQKLHLDVRFPFFIKRFLNVRKSFRMDPVLTLLAPIYILRIHL